MNDYTRVEHQGWISRLGGAIKGMLGGLVLLVVALGLQFWNEGRTLKRDALLNDGRASVQTVPADAPQPANDGRLVHLVGNARATAAVADEVFGVNLDALALRRRVEMYQWQEKRERREEKKLGGGTRTVTEYRYEKRWDDDPIDSSRFENAGGHVNPGALPFEDETRQADEVRVGGFVLAPEVAHEIDGWKSVAPAQVTLPPNLAASFRAADGWFTTSVDPDAPAIGDVRVRFDQLPGGVVSIIARQQHDRLVPRLADGADTLVLVERGELTSAAMFDAAANRNSRTAWILRVVGFVLAWIGIGLLFRPLVVFADVLPAFGRLAGFGTALLSAVLAAVISLVGISSGWLWYRPWALILVVATIVAMLVWWLRRGRTPVAATGAGGPPPGPIAPPPPPPPGH